MGKERKAYNHSSGDFFEATGYHVEEVLFYSDEIDDFFNDIGGFPASWIAEKLYKLFISPHHDNRMKAAILLSMINATEKEKFQETMIERIEERIGIVPGSEFGFNHGEGTVWEALGLKKIDDRAIQKLSGCSRKMKTATTTRAMEALEEFISSDICLRSKAIVLALHFFHLIEILVFGVLGEEEAGTA